MSDILFYNRPVPLHKDSCKSLRIHTGQPDYSFARDTNSVPLVASEFGACVAHYPIVFVGAKSKSLMPVALLGVRDEENLFVDSSGQWTSSYVPAYVRRYPFILAETGEDDGEKFTVYFDSEFSGLEDKDEGELLFHSDGEPAPYLAGVLDFLRDYQAQSEATKTWVQQLSDLDLLVERSLNVQRPDDEQLTLNGFYVVDTERVQALSDVEITRLFRTGALHLIEAHWLSLARIDAVAAHLDHAPLRLIETMTKPARIDDVDSHENSQDESSSEAVQGK